MKPIMFLMLGALCVAPSAGADDASGQTIAFACSGCHGIKDLGKGAVPVLKGQDAAYIEKAMLEFKAGTKTGTIMPRIAKGFSETELKAVAEYYGSLK